MKFFYSIILFLLFGSCSPTRKINSGPGSRIIQLEMGAMMDTITVVVNGHISDFKTRENIPAAVVQLRNENEKYKITVADSVGGFKFSHLAAGKYYLSVSSFGYNKLKDTVVILISGGIYNLKVGLGFDPKMRNLSF